MQKKKAHTNKFQFVVAAHHLAPRYTGVFTVEKTGRKGKAVTKTVDGKAVQLVLRELAATANGETGQVYASYDRLMFFRNPLQGHH